MYRQETYNLTQCVYLIRDYIRDEITKSKGKIVLKEVNQALGTAINGGGVASACLSLDKAEPTMLTKEMYEEVTKVVLSLFKQGIRSATQGIRRTTQTI